MGQSVRKYLENYGTRIIAWLREPDNPALFLHAYATAIGKTNKPRYRTVLKIAETGLWIVAASSLGYCAYRYSSAAVHQHHQRARLDAYLKLHDTGRGAGHDTSSVGVRATLASLSTSQTVATSDAFVRNGLLGTIEIPRLEISSVVEEGVDDATLWEAVGHIPGTAMPGERGNSALAAHRDTYFRELGDVQIGDLIVFHSPYTNFRYRVTSTKIVDGTATDALPDSATPTLSLVTCYPFHYVGPAPKRFIVTAREESASQ